MSSSPRIYYFRPISSRVQDKMHRSVRKPHKPYVNAHDVAEEKGIAKAKAKAAASGVAAAAKTKYLSAQQMAMRQLKVENATEALAQIDKAHSMDVYAKQYDLEDAKKAVPGLVKPLDDAKRPSRRQVSLENHAKTRFWEMLAAHDVNNRNTPKFGQYTMMDKNTKKNLKNQASKERKQSAYDQRLEEMKEKQRREMGLIPAAAINTWGVNPKIEDIVTDCNDRFQFNRPDGVESQDWCAADMKELDKLPMLFLLAVNHFTGSIKDEMASDSGIPFTFRRMNKFVRVNGALKKRYDAGDISTLTSHMRDIMSKPEFTKFDQCNGEQVRLFLHAICSPHKIVIPRSDIDLIVGTLSMHLPSSQAMSCVVYDMVNQGKIMNSMCLNLVMGIIYLLNAAIRNLQ